MAQASACALRSTPIRMSGFFSPKNFRKYQKPQLVSLNFKALFETQADACAMNLLLFHNKNPQHIPVEFKSCHYLVLSNLKLFMAQASACALRSTPIRMSGLFSPKNFRKYQKPQL